MGDYTPRSGIYLMGGGSTGLILPDEPVDVDKINSNMRIIDNLLGARNIPSASSYGGTMDGDLVYTQDTGYLHMYSAADTALINPRLPGARMYSGTRAQRMAFIPRAKEGDLWRDTDNIGAIWALSGASPGVWVYSGNRMRGTKAAMDQVVTDGIAVEGMYATCTDDNSDYVIRPGKAPALFNWAGASTSLTLSSGALASATWTVFSNVANWNVYSKMADPHWLNGIIVPATGMYNVSGALQVSAALSLVWAAKKNNIAANSVGIVAAEGASGFSGATYASFSVNMRLEAGDVITPAGYVTGAAGPYGLTPSGTHFSVTRI